MAEALTDKVMRLGGFDTWEIAETHPGAFFENMLADHPFLPKTSRLLLADYVTMDSGTAASTPPPASAPTTMRPAGATAWTWWCPWTTRAATPTTPASTPA